MSGDDRALVGRTIAGKFLIESFLGGGAMGKVYRARQVALEKTVAVKVMHRELASDGMFAARFHREAKAASRLDHPNSIRVIDFGEEPDGLLYIAMEFVDGRDLFHVIQNEWPLPPSRIAEVLMQTLAALAVAHDMNVVHRDLKPENIMILAGKSDEGHPIDIVKVCDFGIAKINDSRADADAKGKAGAKLTTQGLVVGTPEYMSPEQGRGEPLDARSDLYSVGIILYQMLTGRVPFEAESAIGIVLKHVSEEPVAPSQLRPGADASLEAVCLKAMRKKREERFQSAREMRAELRSLFDPSAAAFARAKTELLQSVGTLPAVASATSVTSAEIGSAPTLQALDSGAVINALAAAQKTPSKITPAGTEALAAQAPAARGSRAALVVGLVALVGVSIAGTLVAVSRRAASHVDDPASTTSIANGNAPVATLGPQASASNTPNTPSATTAAPLIAAEPKAPEPKAPDSRPGEPKGANAKSIAKGEKPAASHALAGAHPEAPPATPILDTPVSTPAPTAAPSASAPPSAPPSPPAPAPTPTVAAAPAAPPAAAPIVAAPFVPEHAFLLIHQVETTQGLASSKVRNTLQRVHPAMNQCYRAALAAQGSASRGEAVLHIAIDDTGRVTSATLNGAGFLPAMRPCIESSVRNLKFPDVDTGEATTDVHLEFKAD